MTHPTGRRRCSALLAGLATLAITLGFAAIPAQAAPPSPDVDYVALGDSYTAGTGAGPFTTPPPCLQTDGGYADIVNDSPPVNLVDNAACHGALLRGGGVPSVEQQIGYLSTTGQLSGDTELVSLTAGANDVGVSAVLNACATSNETECAAEVKAAVGRFPALRAGLTQTYRAIHGLAPNAKIAVLGYPRLFDPVGGAPVIPVKNQILVNQATALLNVTIAAAVVTADIFYKANAQYVDVAARFRGHEANTAHQWIVLDLEPPVEFTPQTFHPNPTGHEQYAAALTSAVNLPALARP